MSPLSPAVRVQGLSLQGKHRPGVPGGMPTRSTAYWGIAYNKRRPWRDWACASRAFAQSYFTSIDTLTLICPGSLPPANSSARPAWRGAGVFRRRNSVLPAAVGTALATASSSQAK